MLIGIFCAAVVTFASIALSVIVCVTIGQFNHDEENPT